MQQFSFKHGTRCPRTQHVRSQRTHRPFVKPTHHHIHQQHTAAASVPLEGQSQPEPERRYEIFPRLKERDPYKLLGVSKDADFEEIQTAKNYLTDLYRWHEPSREAIELALDAVLDEKYKDRHKYGFRPPRTGRRTDVIGVRYRTSTLWRKFTDLFDPTVTLTTLVNQGFVFAIFAFWALNSADQSFPMVGTILNCVWQFQAKRIKRDPEGEQEGNPMVGAIISTVIIIGAACAVLALGNVAVQAVVPSFVLDSRVAACLTIIATGILSVYVK